MKKINLLSRIALVAVLSLALTGLAQGQGQGKGRLKAEFDEELTPLQSAIANIVTDREKKGKDRPKLTLKCNNSNSPKCDQALPEPCLDCGELTNRNGMLVGRKNRTETIIEYAIPGQRKNGMTKFDRIKVGGRNSDGFGAGPERSWKGSERPTGRPDLDSISDRDAAAALGGYAGEMNLAQARMRQGRSGLTDPVNNDLDCIDTVTRQWASEDGCFADTDNGVLLTTMTELFEDDDSGNSVGVGCEHIATGERFTESSDDGDEDICYDEYGFFKATSLEELFDEDGPDFAEKIDQDGDGAFDEDPSESGDVVASCRMFYIAEGLLFDETRDVVDDQCDMTRAFMVKFNRDMVAMPGNKDGERAYLVNDQGLPIVDEETVKKPEYRRAKAYGKHPRKVKIREDFAIKCRGNQELVDGECVKALNNNNIAQLAYFKAMADDVPGFDRNQTSPMLMGFTFAPPVIEWGYKIDEEVCVDFGFEELCGEVFFARIGYEFDIAAGLRLPIHVELTELPSTSAPGALAESMPVIRTSLEPKDFTVGEFKKICVDNNLSDNCTRFAFPEFLDSFNPFKNPDAIDGAEMVAKETIFAGIQVRVLSVPLINWAVDSDVDIMSMCTMLQIKGAVEGASLLDIAKIGVDLAQGQTTELLNALKENNCASFTTPFGFDEEGDLRTFPFTQGFDVRADCAEAFARGEVINVKGKPRPICTGLVLGAHGASLGVGLGVEASLGSTRIDADWSSSGDRDPLTGNGKLIYRHLPGNEAEVLDIQLTADNFEDGDHRDTARIELDDFVYYLNTINLSLSATLQFGGILSPIPDIASFKLFDLVLTGDDIGIPIGQHSGMDPIKAEFFVRNYALTVDGKPADNDPARVDIDTLLIKPGEAGAYQVRVNNRGSVEGNFDNLRFALSNQRDQLMPYSFTINPNTDLDCVDVGADNAHFFGNPYDGIADDCYTIGGTVRSDRRELINEDGPGPEGALAAERDSDGDGLADEDPVENWQAAFLGNPIIEAVSAYSESNEFRTLEITPFRHPLTSPGRYPVQILADSVEAKANVLSAVDPVDQTRTDAENVVFILVDAFFDPLIAAQLKAESGKPGIGKAYTVEVSNGSNVEDTIAVDTNQVDSNQVGCTLTTLGNSDECPYRATPTAIPSGWTNGALPTPAGPLQPLGLASNQFTVDVPTDWAGMEDTTYQVVFTVTSTKDTESPPASNNVLIEQTVIATMESMTRYIGLELLELIEVLDQAEANGIATAGLKPISIHAVKGTNDRSLDSILAGGLRKAASSHAANIRIMGGFTRALAGSGKKLPAELFDDLNARAVAIIADMRTAEANQIPSN